MFICCSLQQEKKLSNLNRQLFNFLKISIKWLSFVKLSEHSFISLKLWLSLKQFAKWIKFMFSKYISLWEFSLLFLPFPFFVLYQICSISLAVFFLNLDASLPYPTTSHTSHLSILSMKNWSVSFLHNDYIFNVQHTSSHIENVLIK